MQWQPSIAAARRGEHSRAQHGKAVAAEAWGATGGKAKQSSGRNGKPEQNVGEAITTPAHHRVGRRRRQMTATRKKSETNGATNGISTANGPQTTDSIVGLVIEPPNFQILDVQIIGITPLVVHAWSSKARR